MSAKNDKGAVTLTLTVNRAVWLLGGIQRALNMGGDPWLADTEREALQETAWELQRLMRGQGVNPWTGETRA